MPAIDHIRRSPRGRIWIGVTFFLMAFAPGLWFSSLSNVLAAHGMETTLPAAFACVSGFAILSPLFLGAWADQKISADRLLGILSLAGAGFLFLAFLGVERGWGPWAFLVFLSLNALVSGPMWSLLSSIALANGDSPEKSFPLYRVWGTIGWMVAGLVTSHVLKADHSPIGGQFSALVRVLVAGACLFLLPRTAPKGGPAKTWMERLGLGALRNLRGRDELIFLTTSFLLAVFLTPFLMYAPRHLDALGAENITAKMTLGQITEIPAILLIGYLTMRFRFKHLLVVAMVACVARYVLFAMAGVNSSISLVLAGVFLHGICYTLFFITGQLFMERRGTEGTRSQGQALYGLLSFGVGSVIGSPLSGMIHRATVINDQGGWTWFWGIHAGLCFALLLLFVVGYRSTLRTVQMAPNL